MKSERHPDPAEQPRFPDAPGPDTEPLDLMPADVVPDDEFADGFTSAVTTFRDELGSLFSSPAAERGLVALYDDYVGVYQQALQSPAVVGLAAERQARYSAAIREEFSDEARSDLHDAFRAYLAALQQAWAEIDPDTLAPADLISITEEMRWVADVVTAVEQATDGGGSP